MGRTNALHSLYGGKAARLKLAAEAEGKALAGNVGGQKRNQTVLTTQWFLNELRKNVDRPLGYDPCTTPWNPCKALTFSTEKTNGLTVNWAKQSQKHGWIYVNPPYDDLKRWMVKALMESERGAQIYMLAPFRPWRTWFCELIPFSDTLDRRIVTSLAPMPFEGEKSAYPAPLCVIPYNLSLPYIVNPRGKNMVTGHWDMVVAA